MKRWRESLIAILQYGQSTSTLLVLCFQGHVTAKCTSEQDQSGGHIDSRVKRVQFSDNVRRKLWVLGLVLICTDKRKLAVTGAGV